MQVYCQLMDDLVCSFKEWSWGHALSWEPHISKGMKAKMVFFLPEPNLDGFI